MNSAASSDSSTPPRRRFWLIGLGLLTLVLGAVVLSFLQGPPLRALLVSRLEQRLGCEVEVKSAYWRPWSSQLWLRELRITMPQTKTQAARVLRVDTLELALGEAKAPDSVVLEVLRLSNLRLEGEPDTGALIQALKDLHERFKERRKRVIRWLQIRRLSIHDMRGRLVLGGRAFDYEDLDFEAFQVSNRPWLQAQPMHLAWVGRRAQGTEAWLGAGRLDFRPSALEDSPHWVWPPVFEDSKTRALWRCLESHAEQLDFLNASFEKGPTDNRQVLLLTPKRKKTLLGRLADAVVPLDVASRRVHDEQAQGLFFNLKAPLSDERTARLDFAWQTAEKFFSSELWSFGESVKKSYDSVKNTLEKAIQDQLDKLKKPRRRNSKRRNSKR